MGIYAQPAAHESSANLVRPYSMAGTVRPDEGDDDEVDDGVGFAAGYRSRQLSVPWWEAICCCACWGGDDDGEEQEGRTCPAYV
jgi:hypothetical protein